MTTSTGPQVRMSELVPELRAAGLFENDHVQQFVRYAVVLAALALSLCVLHLTDIAWIQALNAVFLAFVFGQAAFIGHDIGHRQALRRNGWGREAGKLVFGLVVGVSTTWWISKHNRHHSNPNDPDKDPDTKLFLLSFMEKHAYAFFLLQTIKALGMRINSIQYLIHQDNSHRRPEMILVFSHMGILTFLAMEGLGFLPGLAFLAINQMALGLYVGLVFAPNHKGMVLITGDLKEQDFISRQVLTSRNVKGNRLVDLAFGGLNYQIEHHLCPHLPSHNLRRASPIVKGYCVSRGLRYQEESLFKSYASVIRHLRLSSGSIGATAPDRL